MIGYPIQLGRLSAIHTNEMNPHANLAGVEPSPTSGVTYSHFDVKSLAPDKQLLAWRERVGHVIDVLPSRADVRRPFRAAIERYGVGDLSFTDCRSETMVLERSLARISTDNARSFYFHVFVEGDADCVSVRSSARSHNSGAATLLALDLGQPVRMRRNTCRVLSFFVPGAVAAQVFPDPEALHGRMMRNETPLTRLIVGHAMALSREIPFMGAEAANDAIRTGADLLVAAFGQQAGLIGNARSAARAAMFGQARRYIQANLHEADLSPESVVQALQAARPSVYRLFQHEGGLRTYIRHLRLKQAADEIAHHRHRTLTEIAYGLGFTSPSDFTRAFRRAYGISPRDFREISATKA
ncbi:AraC family transcriptional regulator [Paraburkholderia bannensis]|uniref:AraC family transcriptional regulator n=1 Tax=Paraburkholderia bannensis TaxID=765414 RepID=UPI002AB6EAC8|nr:AraC family transcriptional regulator [Paraburkholderia bannensis]